MGRWWRCAVVGVLIGGLMGCRTHAPEARDPSANGFRSLRRTTVGSGEPLPKERVRLTAYVVSVAAFRGGTIMELAEPDDHDQRLLIVYGAAADSLYATKMQGHMMELEFTATGHVKVPDGRTAVRVAISGIKMAEGQPAGAGDAR